MSEQPIPSVIVPLEVGRTEQYVYEIYAYIKKTESLDLLIQRTSPIHPFKLASILRQLLEAVQALHEKSIIHADIKPSNILIKENQVNAPPEIYLIDFGMAVSKRPSHEIIIVGTYDYLPPPI